MSQYQELESAKYFQTNEEPPEPSSSSTPLGSMLKLGLVAVLLVGGGFLLVNNEKLRDGFSAENIRNFRRNPTNLLIWFAGTEYMEDAQNRAEWRRYDRQRELEDSLPTPEEHQQMLWDMQLRP